MEDYGKVSIIIPSYKRNYDMVKRAVVSAINQSYSNVEVMLIDDNAKDELSEYRKSNRKVFEDINSEKLKLVLNETNLGGAGSRNHGVEKASGRYITFLDDDDEYLPNKVENQVKYIAENNLDMCFTNLNIYNEKDELIDVRTHNDIKEFNKNYLVRYHMTKQITGTPTFMLTKELFEKIKGFEIVPMGQEFYLMYKIIMADAKIGYCNWCDIKAYRYDIEAISTGPNKISGERKLYEFKKKSFKLLNLKERRYVRCRHNAVMAVAYKRNKKYIRCLLYLVAAVLVDPVLSVKEALGLSKRKREVNK